MVRGKQYYHILSPIFDGYSSFILPCISFVKSKDVIFIREITCSIFFHGLNRLICLSELTWNPQITCISVLKSPFVPQNLHVWRLDSRRSPVEPTPPQPARRPFGLKAPCIRPRSGPTSARRRWRSVRDPRCGRAKRSVTTGGGVKMDENLDENLDDWWMLI